MARPRVAVFQHLANFRPAAGGSGQRGGGEHCPGEEGGNRPIREGRSRDGYSTSLVGFASSLVGFASSLVGSFTSLFGSFTSQVGSFASLDGSFTSLVGFATSLAGSFTSRYESSSATASGPCREEARAHSSVRDAACEPPQLLPVHVRNKCGPAPWSEPLPASPCNFFRPTSGSSTGPQLGASCPPAGFPDAVAHY